MVDESESVNVMVLVAPDFNVPEPDRARDTVGALVSNVIESVELAVLLLLAASVNLFAETEIEAVPLAPAVGVKVAV